MRTGADLGLQSLLVLALVEAACPIMGDIWEQPDQNISATLRGEAWVLCAFIGTLQSLIFFHLDGFSLEGEIVLIATVGRKHQAL